MLTNLNLYFLPLNFEKASRLPNSHCWSEAQSLEKVNVNVAWRFHSLGNHALGWSVRPMLGIDPAVNRDSQAQPEQAMLYRRLTEGGDKVARMKQL